MPRRVCRDRAASCARCADRRIVRRYRWLGPTDSAELVEEWMKPIRTESARGKTAIRRVHIGTILRHQQIERAVIRAVIDNDEVIDAKFSVVAQNVG